MVMVQTVAPPEDWEAPWPYGYADAMDSASSVAAPLLAGFSFTLIALIVPKTQGIRWPGAALSLLVAASLLFIASVQCGFWARMWSIKPSDLTDWRPSDRDVRKHAEQRAHARGNAIWSLRFRRAYRAGILALLAGVAILLVPSGHISFMRWIAIVIAVAGWALEASWIASSWLLKGSPISIYTDEHDEPLQPDEPAAQTPLLWIRRFPPLRRVARRFEPLVESRRAPPPP
jgi:hypothetical protein